METNELKWRWAYLPYLDMPEKQAESALKAGYTKVCYKSEADALIAEKDKEIALLKERICNGDVSRSTWIDDCFDKDKEIEELKAKLESLKATHYAEMVDAGMRERRLKRALWLARAERAKWQSLYYWYAISDKFKSRKFDEVERKCRAKAEEYK